VATNLLLEGDDLEALLLKAHAEGGPNARIVRADKYRHGGLWGFFARERFEVAVEIPQPGGGILGGVLGGAPVQVGGQVAGEGPDDGGVPPVSAAYAEQAYAEHGYLDDGYPDLVPAEQGYTERAYAEQAYAEQGYAGHGEDVRAGLAGGGHPAAARWEHPADVAPPAVSARPGRPADVLAPDGVLAPCPPALGGTPDRQPRAWEPAPPDDDRLLPVATRRAEAPTGRASWPEDPWPEEPPADGLLGIADRVSAAERAATKAVQAMLAASPQPSTSPSRTPARPQPRTPGRAPSSVVLPGAELVGATLATMAAGGRPAAAPLTVRAARTPVRAGGPDGHLPARPATRHPSPRPGTPGANRIGDRIGDRIGREALQALLALAEEEDVSHEPSPSPVHPSTSRPEFTALLDQLRDDAYPPARPARPAVRAAYLDVDGLPDDADRPDDVELLRHAPGPSPEPFPEPFPEHRPAASVPAPRTPAEHRADQHRADQHAPDGDPQPGDVRTADPRTAADRRVLRELGVPAAWTRRLRPGDRFGEVLRMLERMPDPDMNPDTPVVAVVGPAAAVRLEAHRAAVDLAAGADPRPVVVVPATVGTERAGALARAMRSGPVVLAVETDGADASLVLDTLTTVQAGVVIAMIDAAAPLERTQRWLDALGQVDALALEGGSAAADPAAALQLGVPVIRYDGVPVDRVTWTALLCAQLLAADHAPGSPSA